MKIKIILGLLVLAWIGNAIALFSYSGPDVTLLNASYDPTRGLYGEINELFSDHYEHNRGVTVAIKLTHAGSGSQARAIIDGLDAYVATLALWGDTDAIRKKGLIKDGWEDRLPEKSLPYYSTIVFVVRKGNPRQIKDWPDLIQPGVGIITPNPKTSGNGQLSFLAAWGAKKTRGGTDKEAEAFVTQIYKQTPVLDAAARGSTTTFAQKGIGDVHLTWENEAHLEVAEARGELEIVYPPVSIKAEPHVALVDANVDRKGTRKVAEEYLKFLYTDQAQNVIAKHFYRPINKDVLPKHAATFPAIKLFSITEVTKGGWGEAKTRFFGQGGVFDRIFEKK